VAALERFKRHVQHCQVIGHEESVKLGRFELLDEIFEVGKVEVCIRE
jgi:hypothetical protein